jgi:hypothetical protein
MVLLLSLLFVFAAFDARAQLQLFRVESGIEYPVGGSYLLPSTPVGQSVETRFRVRNTSDGPVIITRLYVAGVAFRLSGDPSLPHIISPGGNMDFTVRFLPPDTGSYSAHLAVNSLNLILIGQVRPGATIALEEGGRRTPVPSGAVVDFGRIEAGNAVARRFVLENSTASSLLIEKTVLEGNGFGSSDWPAFPLQLEPGGAVLLTVIFAPQAEGPFRGLLNVDGRRIELAGSAFAPPLPQPSLILEPATASSAQQVKLWVRFASPVRLTATGTVALSFEPLVAGAQDAAIQFVAGGAGRSAAFTVLKDAQGARFGAEEAAIFQTGTTAGVLTITVRAGDQKEELRLTIPPQPAKVDSVHATRGTASLDLRINGFDNTRSLSSASFSFYDRSGKIIAPGAIRVNVTAEFERFFQTSTMGGVFSLRAVFPVSGSVNDIDQVEIELVNSAGTSTSGRIRL